MTRIIAFHLIASLLIVLTQSKVQMRFQKCEIAVHNTSVIQDARCNAKPINRTTTLVNLTALIAEELNDVSLNIQMFKQSEITYRPFQMNVTENWCKFMYLNRASAYLRLISSVFLPYTNLNHTCPYSGEAKIRNLPVTSEKLSAFWPVGMYRVDVTALEGKMRLITMSFFVEMKEMRVG